MKKNKNGGNITVLSAVLVSLIIVLGWLSYMRFFSGKPKKGPEQKPSTAIKSTPIPLQPGPGKYSISQGKHEGPTFTTVTIDPLDAKKGQTMKITTSISNRTDIDKVTGNLQTDNTTEGLTFTRISGDAKKGVWETTIKLDDTILYTYTLTISAAASNGVSTIKVSPR